MKRSQVNQIIRDGLEFCRRMNFHLPPFATWTPQDWATRGHEFDEIRDNMLGWDVTNFGSGNFAETGLLVFTIRNGNASLTNMRSLMRRNCSSCASDRSRPTTFTILRWRTSLTGVAAI